jgi:tRNA (guanine-N7-)-methyltransferase
MHGYKFYGRRHGRRLNLARETAMEEDLPRFAIDIPEDTPAGSLAPAAFFAGAAYKDYWLEIGFGTGEHLAAQAGMNPDTGMIGCEPFINGVAALLTTMAKTAVENIRIWPDDARVLLDALEAASLSKIFLLHPDPWPKKRHHKRRFIQTETLDAFARLLHKGGELRIATDDADLANWMLSKTWSHPCFDFQADCADDWRQRPDDWPETRYGQKQLAGQPVYFRFLRV